MENTLPFWPPGQAQVSAPPLSKHRGAQLHQFKALAVSTQRGENGADGLYLSDHLPTHYKHFSLPSGLKNSPR